MVDTALIDSDKVHYGLPRFLQGLWSLILFGIKGSVVVVVVVVVVDLGNMQKTREHTRH